MDILVENEVTDSFVVVGGGAMHLDNAMAKCDGIKTVFDHHEQACAMAAEAYAKASGKPALVCVTCGPGGLNTLNGVQGAYVDNVPMIVISGQIRQAISVESTGLPLRFRGVQEHEITQTVKTMTKYAVKVRKPENIRYELEKAIKIATTGRKGPVWIDVPLDIQSAIIEDSELAGFNETLPEEACYTIKEGDIEYLKNCFAKAKRPIVLAGSGIKSAGAVDMFRDLMRTWNIPVVGGSQQAAILYEGFPRYYGLSGITGPRCGNYIIQNSDLILVIGNSLSFMQTGFEVSKFANSSKIITVDVDENESKKPDLHVDRCIVADAKAFCSYLLDNEIRFDCDRSWISFCEEVYERFPACEYDPQNASEEGISCYTAWNEFMKVAKEDAVVALGNSDCVAAPLQIGTRFKDQKVIVNYNCGSMGDDIPEALGAAVALKKDVYCITGDGSIMLNIQELQTIYHNNLPVKIIMFNNGGYGTIRETNKNFFKGTYFGCDKNSGISFPDMEKVSDAFGIPYRRCSSEDELKDAFTWLIDQPKYAFLEIMEKFDDPIVPKVMSRMLPDNSFYTPALHDMYPFVDEDTLNRFTCYCKGDK